MRHLSLLLPALAWSVACDEDAVVVVSGADVTTDATTDARDRDATIADASDADVVDAQLDSYVAWCDAGPPLLLADAGCGIYFDVPCGLPPGLVVDDAGNIDRCDQICVGATDDLCAQLPPWFTAVLLDAGLIDAGTADTVDAGAVFIVCACQGAGGRRPEGLLPRDARASSAVGAFFAHAAHLEAASVHAFARMRDELRTLDAPNALVTATTRAIADERRHARVVSALARRFGATAIRPRVKRARKRSLESIAIENATEGCVRETFAALVACWQALHARDPIARAAYARIARDEARHAELAHAAARFFESMLGAAARDRVERARDAALTNLAREAVEPPNALVQLAGLPTKTFSLRLLSKFRDALA
ncbi:MAG TPA: hypothetical protein VGH87_02365 [Polyangiaceae bacterium]|jgi:hypothetical protein